MDKSTAEVVPRAMPEVSQERLWQTHKMAAVGRLSDGIAHEFNNLMQAVIAFMELTRKLILGGRASEAEQFIARAIAAAQNASLLNQHVSRFARFNAIAPSALSMNAVIANVQELLRHSLSREFKLEIELAADPWTVHCDAGQAQIAIVDMVLDARDSMPGGGTIAIATRNDVWRDARSASDAAPVTGDRVCVAVTSTSDRNMQAFDRETTSPSPVDTNESLGGLDMVDRFARIHGGEMALRRDEPHRCVIEVYLPRLAAV